MSMSDRKSCSGCHRIIEDRRFLTCGLCGRCYDLDCAGVTEQCFYNTLTGERRAAWKCVACFSQQPKTDNTETPVRVTLRRAAARQRSVDLDGSLPDRPDAENLDDTAHNMTVDVTDVQVLFMEMRQFREEMRAEMKAMRAEMGATRARIDGLGDEMLELSGRVARCEDRIGVIEADVSGGIGAVGARIDAVEQRVEAAVRRQAEAGPGPGAEAVAGLQRTVAELRMELGERDQEALLADLDIGQLPEERGENVVHSVMVLAGRLGVPLEERDVVFAERLGAPAGEGAGAGAGARARRVVVRLARRHLRDELLRAARVRRGLAEGGARVYVNERLTRANRLLFQRVREECRRLQWRYSWTRRGRIFARKTDGAQVYQFRTPGDLERVFTTI